MGIPGIRSPRCGDSGSPPGYGITRLYMGLLKEGTGWAYRCRKMRQLQLMPRELAKPDPTFAEQATA